MSVELTPSVGVTPPSPTVQDQQAGRATVSFANFPAAPLPSRAHPHEFWPLLAQWVNESPAEEADSRLIAARIVDSAVGRGFVAPINLADMRLSSLPPVPPWTQQISARDNRLTALPSSLPPALTLLDATNNQIDRVPPSLLEQPSRAAIVLLGNPVVEEVQLEVRHAERQRGYRGPGFVFSPAVPATVAPGIEQRPGR